MIVYPLAIVSTHTFDGKGRAGRPKRDWMASKAVDRPKPGMAFVQWFFQSAGRPVNVIELWFKELQEPE